MALPAGLSPATRRFEAARSDTLSYGSKPEWGNGLLECWIDGTDGRPIWAFNNPSIPYSITPFRSWWVATVLPRALRFKKTAASLQCLQPDRDAKAELNRRSRVCEAPAGTGVRVA